MTDQWLTDFKTQLQNLTGRVDATAPAERDAVKREIIALFKRVDAALTDLGEIKDEIRGLVERYKQASSITDTSPAPQFNGARPAVHADHLGASTYIEKGWSLISLGDYPGAVQALDKALTLSPGAVQA
jgi:tetratricopeptide (TPR) repeat protein